MISKISKTYETSQYESSHSAWYETEHQFSFEVFGNFSKVYVSVEDLAVRRMHVDPDRLLFMFDERILIFLKSDSFYLPSVKTPKMAANPLKKTEIRRYTTKDPAFRPFFQRYGWTLCVFPRRKTGTNFHREAIPPAPVGVVWIRTRMSDGRIFYFPFLHVAYFLKLTDYADAQADLRLCCLHATKSSFAQQGTYGMG